MSQSLLRIPGFPVYLIGRFLLALLARSQAVAIGYHLYELTNDPIALGYVGLAMFLPVVGFGLFAGDIADRVNRAMVLSVGSACAAASSCGLFAIAIYDVRVTWPFYVLAALYASAMSFVRPAHPSLITEIVPAPQLASAIAMAAGASQMASVIGPAAVGATLIAGPAAAYAAMAVVAAIASVLWLRLRHLAVSARPAHTELSTVQRITEGIRIVIHSPIILGAISLDLFAVLLGGVIVLLPVFARDILMVGPVGLGLLRSAPAVGAGVAALVLSRVGFPRNAGKIMLSGVAAFGVAMLVFGFSRSLTLSLAALCVAGVMDMMSNVVRSTAIQLSTPNAFRGRVNSVEQLFVSGSNELGDFRAGISAGLIGVVPAVIVGGACTIMVTLLWAVFFPSLRNLDRLSDLRPHEKVSGREATDAG